MSRFGVHLTYFVESRSRQIPYNQRETVKFHAFFVLIGECMDCMALQ